MNYKLAYVFLETVFVNKNLYVPINVENSMSSSSSYSSSSSSSSPSFALDN